MPRGISLRDVLHLKSLPKISDRKIIGLINHFGSTEELLAASPRTLVKLSGIKRTDALMIRNSPVDEKMIERQFSLLNKLNGTIISYWDSDYPALLKSIYDPPVVLFVRGKIHPNDHCSIAIVGTRHPTAYGKSTAEKFSAELTQRGITVVSGLARGIDTVVHRQTMRQNGRTIAVLGGSIDKIYPQENTKLVEQIESEKCGAVISELMMSTPSHPAFFPRRNRIISGMTLGTLVVESNNNGGAMITAATAIDQNRELFCIPGPITERKSIGTNALIKNGQAKLVQTVDDLIDELRLSLRPVLKNDEHPVSLPQFNAFEQKILDVVPSEPVHIDLISEMSQLSSSDVLVNLLSLEFKGVIRQMAGKMFHKV